MNIAIIGSDGYIAGYLIDRFEKDLSVERIIKIDQTDSADEYLNLTDPQKFKYDILDEIDYVIFTAAISSPDKCSENYDFCWSINVTGTEYFIHKAIEHNCRVLFFSSDAVYGDSPGMIYNEESITEAKTPYGKMKKAVEDEFKNEKMFKAIRLSYVVSQNDRFISYCIRCIETGDIADVFHPFYRNVVTVSDVVDVVIWFCYHWDEYEQQILCVAGRELVSRVRIADELNRLYGDKLQFAIIYPGETFYRNRPKITQMQSLFLHKMNIIRDKTFTEKIQVQLEGKKWLRER